jgi:hypothetical protein
LKLVQQLEAPVEMVAVWEQALVRFEEVLAMPVEVQAPAGARRMSSLQEPTLVYMMQLT